MIFLGECLLLWNVINLVFFLIRVLILMHVIKTLHAFVCCFFFACLFKYAKLHYSIPSKGKYNWHAISIFKTSFQYFLDKKNWRSIHTLFCSKCHKSKCYKRYCMNCIIFISNIAGKWYSNWLPFIPLIAYNDILRRLTSLMDEVS